MAQGQQSTGSFLPTKSPVKNAQASKNSSQEAHNYIDAQMAGLVAQLKQSAAYFDGSAAVGAMTLKTGLNVLNIIKTGTGVYQVTFSQPQPTSDYLVHPSAGSATAATIYLAHAYNLGPSGFTLVVQTVAGAPVDATAVRFTV